MRGDLVAHLPNTSRFESRTVPPPTQLNEQNGNLWHFQHRTLIDDKFQSGN